MIGSRIGHFEITAKLGEGGMGEVWRARDTELDREVAIKLLPDALVSDPERAARFEREAKVLASLNHPHIAQIYEVGRGTPNIEDADEPDPHPRAQRPVPTQAPGSATSTARLHYLVLELVEGPTLAERLEEGPLPLEEALPLARQIAEALEEAHERGIIHRDLKPANVKLTGNGQAKVLDFGLAKALDPVASGGQTATQLAHSPTLTMQATLQGVILGTAAYMSPEQAAGGEADRRADIWSFGVVLYEMLTGARLFEGESVSHVMAGVLKEEPDFGALPDETPPRVRRLVGRCLRKKVRERLQSIGDARVVLDEVLAGVRDDPVETPPSAVPARRSVWRSVVALAIAAALGVLAAWGILGRRPSPAPRARTLAELPFPGYRSLGDPQLSPDGSKLAVQVLDPTTSLWMLAIRTLATGDVRLLPGTDSSERPFWSPDGRSVGFYAYRADEIRRVDLEGGPPVRLAHTGRFYGGTWGPREILFGNQDGLYRIPTSGGEPTLLRSVADVEGAKGLGAPAFLPDGRHFTYLVWDGDETTIHLGSTDSDRDAPLVRSDSRGVVVGGNLLYLRGGTLLAKRLEVGRAELGSEDAEILAQGIGGRSGGEFTVAAGLLVYQSGGAETGSQILVYGRDGLVQEAIPSETFLDDLILAPGDGQAAVMRDAPSEDADSPDNDVWTLDLERKIFNRVTYEGADDPAFSPDGRTIAYAHEGDLYRKPSDGTGDPELLVESPNDIVTNQWTSDGWILYSDIAEGDENLYAVAEDGGEPRQLTSAPYRELHGQVSPDGRWLAYTSTESGDPQVYLTRWPDIRGKWRVSKDAAAMPRWRGDSRELYMVSADKRLTRVAVSVSGDDPVIGVPEAMFTVELDGSVMVRTPRWAVTADGERFLVLAAPAAEEEGTSSLTLVTLPGWGEPGR